LFNVKQGDALEVKGTGGQADHSLPCNAEVNVSGFIPPSSHKPSRDAQ